MLFENTDGGEEARTEERPLEEDAVLQADNQINIENTLEQGMRMSKSTGPEAEAVTLETNAWWGWWGWWGDSQQEAAGQVLKSRSC